MTSLKVRCVRDLGPQFVNNPHRLVGQDGAYSIPMGDHSLWFFGDTLIGERMPGTSLWYVGDQPLKPADLTIGWNKIEHLVHNSTAIVSNRVNDSGNLDFRHLTEPNGQIRQLISLLPDEDPLVDRIWCFHGLAEKNLLNLFYQKIRWIEDQDNPLPVAFEVVGSGLAIGNTDDWNFRRIKYRNSTIIWKHNQPQFGAVALPVADEQKIYLYGVLRNPATGIQNVYVARTNSGQLDAISEYEYLTDIRQGKWSHKISEAAIVFTGPPNELSVSFNKFLNSYLAVHSDGITGRIVGRTATNPWGPWSYATLLHQVAEPPDPIPYPRLIYAAKEHPELVQHDGRRIFITYIEFEEYFPHLLEIDLDA